MNMVPKVHPATRPVESADPMELTAEFAPGDPEVMLDCLIAEFTGLGYEARQLLPMFHDPEYPVLNQLRECFGDDEIRRRCEESCTGWDAVRVTAEFDEDPELGDDELIQLQVRRR